VAAASGYGKTHQLIQKIKNELNSKLQISLLDV